VTDEGVSSDNFRANQIMNSSSSNNYNGPYNSQQQQHSQRRAPSPLSADDGSSLYPYAVSVLVLRFTNTAVQHRIIPSMTKLLCRPAAGEAAEAAEWRRPSVLLLRFLLEVTLGIYEYSSPAVKTDLATLFTLSLFNFFDSFSSSHLRRPVEREVLFDVLSTYVDSPNLLYTARVAAPFADRSVRFLHLRLSASLEYLKSQALQVRIMGLSQLRERIEETVKLERDAADKLESAKQRVSEGGVKGGGGGREVEADKRASEQESIGKGLGTFYLPCLCS